MKRLAFAIPRAPCHAKMKRYVRRFVKLCCYWNFHLAVSQSHEQSFPLSYVNLSLSCLILSHSLVLSLSLILSLSYLFTLYYLISLSYLFTLSCLILSLSLILFYLSLILSYLLFILSLSYLILYIPYLISPLSNHISPLSYLPLVLSYLSLILPYVSYRLSSGHYFTGSTPCAPLPPFLPSAHHEALTNALALPGDLWKGPSKQFSRYLPVLLENIGLQLSPVPFPPFPSLPLPSPFLPPPSFTPAVAPFSSPDGVPLPPFPTPLSPRLTGNPQVIVYI